jgi:cysteine-rich repeat protein
MSKPSQAFEMLDMSSMDGQCIPFPEKSFCEAGEQTNTQGHTLLEGSPQSNPNAAISRNSIHLTSPINISSGDHSMMAFAVCQEALDLVCQKTSAVENGTNLVLPGTSCMQQRNVQCLEVATDARFCSMDNKNQIKGRVVERAFGPLANSLGQVCVFDHCKIPASWLTTQQVRRKPSDWCQLVEDGVPDVSTPQKTQPSSSLLDDVELLQLDPDLGLDTEIMTLNGDSIAEDTTRRRRGSWKAQLDAAAAAATVDPSKPATGVFGTEKSASQFWEAEDDSQNEKNKTKIFAVAAEVQKREIVALEQEDYEVDQKAKDAEKELQQKMAQEQQFKQKAKDASIVPPPTLPAGLSDSEKQALQRLSFAKTREVRFKKAAQDALQQSKHRDGKDLMVETETEASQKATTQAKMLSSKQDQLQQLQVKIKQQIRSKELLQKDSLQLNTTAEQLKALDQSKTAELHDLLYSPKDCKVTSWSPLTHCDQKCGYGVKRRQREILRNATNGGAKCPMLAEEYKCLLRECDVCGDGLQSADEQCDDGNLRPADGCDQQCRIESGFKCSGGSVSSKSVCEECGNGVVRSTEECDDGNTEDGDGCSSDCKLEKHFVCFGGSASTSSTCLLTHKFQKSWREQVAEQMWDCHSHPNETKAFVLDSMSSGAGHCEELPELSNLDDRDIGRIDQSQHGTLATDPSAVTSLTTILTPPVPLESVQDAQGLPGVEPYAVCQTNIVKVCFTESLSRKIRQRTCLTQGTSLCREVVVEERFCDAKESISHGARRAYRKYEDPRGKMVCIFSGCRTPSSWIIDEGAGIEPAAWCQLPTWNAIQ